MLKIYTIAQIDSSLIEGCPLRFKYTRLGQDRAISITDALEMLLSLYKEARLTVCILNLNKIVLFH